MSDEQHEALSAEPLPHGWVRIPVTLTLTIPAEAFEGTPAGG